MRSPIVFYIAIAIAVIGLAVGVYYLIPGIHHTILFTLSKAGTVAASDIRPLHAVVGFVVMVVGLVLAFMSRPKKAVAA
ncbi:MAG TPA: hypothetical protein VKT82_34835 [Ktedonobacterales bacterium]|nr:hypothetical protein [Ktedonobacterales bacterium]